MSDDTTFVLLIQIISISGLQFWKVTRSLKVVFQYEIYILMSCVDFVSPHSDACYSTESCDGFESFISARLWYDVIVPVTVTGLPA